MGIVTFAMIAASCYAFGNLVGSYIGFKSFQNRQKRNRLKMLEGSQRRDEISAWNQRSLPDEIRRQKRR